MSLSLPPVPRPVNEPVRGYLPGSAERASLQRELAVMAAEVVEIPCVIDGVDVYTGRTVAVTMPSDHGHVLAAGPTDELRGGRRLEDVFLEAVGSSADDAAADLDWFRPDTAGAAATDAAPSPDRPDLQVVPTR